MEEEKDETHIDNILSMLSSGNKKKEEETEAGAGASREAVNPPSSPPSTSILPSAQQAQAYSSGVAGVAPDNQEAWLANKSALTAKTQAAADLENQRNLLAGIIAEQQAHAHDVQVNHQNAINAHTVKAQVLKDEVERAAQAHQAALDEATAAQAEHFKLNPDASPIKPVQGPDVSVKPRGGQAGSAYAISHAATPEEALRAGNASNVQSNLVKNVGKATNLANEFGGDYLPTGESHLWLNDAERRAYEQLKQPEFQQAEQLTKAKADALATHEIAQSQLKERAKELAMARKAHIEHISNPPTPPVVKTPSPVPRIQQQGRVSSAEGNLAAAENTVKANPGPGPVAKFFEPALKLVGAPLGAYGVYKAAQDMREHGINPENAGAMLESGLTGSAPFNPRLTPAAGGVGMANSLYDMYQHGPTKENVFHAIGSGGMMAAKRFPITGALSQLPAVINETNKYFEKHPELLKKYNENPNP